MTSVIFIFLLVLLLRIQCVRSQQQQDFLDKAYSNQDELPLVGASNHPYVGIPVTRWKISNLNATAKEHVCSDQLKFCATECGGEQLVVKNFCNITTMAWNCACQNHVPDTPPYSWPITIAECQGKEASCSQQCNYGVTQNVCLKGCKRYFKCNKPGGPKSGLQVKDENQLPDYDLPVANDGNDASSASWIFKRESFDSTQCFFILCLLISLV